MKRVYDAIVIGGGVIGCSVAYQLSRRGLKVLVLERGRIGAEASSAAAGMLAAQAELSDTGPYFELLRRSRALFPAIAEELRAITGVDIELIREGLLLAAWTAGQEMELKHRAARQREAGEKAEWLTAAEARRLEGNLSGELRGALHLPGDGQVLAPALTAAYAKGAALSGAELHEHAEVRELLFEQGSVVGVRTDAGSLYSDHVVLTSGVWSSPLLEAAGLNLPMYPVKGECFSVVTPEPLLRRTIYSEDCYLVPKADGRLIVGATVKPHTYERGVSIAGLSGLMERAKRLLPAITEAQWERCWSGLRPQTADGLPYIGKIEGFGELYVAAGHYRNGILLSPITGMAMADWITGDGKVYDVFMEACSPHRVKHVHDRSG